MWTLITFPWVQAELRREKATWGKIQGHTGVPYTDDITAYARTRLNSFQERVFPFTREKPQPPPSPNSGPLHETTVAENPSQSSHSNAENGIINSDGVVSNANGQEKKRPTEDGADR